MEPVTIQVPVRQVILKTFQGQVGIRQTGDNTGPEIDRYLAAVGLKPGYPWCGAFVGWGYMLHSIGIPSGAAWSPSWFTSGKIVPKETALKADVFGIYFSNLGRIAHVGILEEDWDNGRNTIMTIEGNTNDTGSRTGDGVYRKKRSKNQIYRTANWIEQ